MRSALSDQGIALRRDELPTRLEARKIVTEFMVSTGLLGQFQAVGLTALGVEERDDKGAVYITSDPYTFHIHRILGRAPGVSLSV